MKKTTLICTLILVSLLSGCAGNNASQPVSSQDTSVTSSASESTTESITTPETSVPEESTSSYEEAAWIYFKELQVFVYSSACVHSCFSAYNTDSNAVYPEAY